METRLALAIAWLKQHHDPEIECVWLVKGIRNILDGRDAFDDGAVHNETTPRVGERSITPSYGHQETVSVIGDGMEERNQDPE